MDIKDCISVNDSRRLKTVLKDSQMIRGKLQFQEKVNAEDLAIIYRCFRMCMLDGYIPITKPIGFSLVSDEYPLGVSITSRHPCILESQLKLMGNISKLIVVNQAPAKVISKVLRGKIRAGNLDIRFSDGEKVEFLDPSIEICNAIKPVRISLFLNKGTGYELMEGSYHTMRKIALNYGDKSSSSYLPLNTEYSLFNYIRIKPFNRKEIKYSLVGDVKESHFNNLWHDFIKEMR